MSSSLKKKFNVEERYQRLTNTSPYDGFFSGQILDFSCPGVDSSGPSVF